MLVLLARFWEWKVFGPLHIAGCELQAYRVRNGQGFETGSSCAMS